MDGLDRGDDATGSPGARTSRVIGGAEAEVGSSGQHRTCTATIFFHSGLDTANTTNAGGNISGYGFEVS